MSLPFVLLIEEKFSAAAATAALGLLNVEW
jgi:hypothetical protein